MTIAASDGTTVEAKSVLLISFAHTLRYECIGDRRRGLSRHEQVFLIDEMPVRHYHHPMTLDGTRTKKARPRVQLTEEHCQMLHLPVINERSSESTSIVFPNGRVNHVLIARKNSQCPLLRSLHEYMYGTGGDLNYLLSKLDKKCFVKDDLAGGRYVVSGFGNMGKNVSKDVRPPNQPALRQSLKLAEHLSLSKIVGGVLGRVADCLKVHCIHVSRNNQRLMQFMESLVWPPLVFQNRCSQWMSCQYIVRRWGTLSMECGPKENSLVALHTDRGDVDTTMFNCYTSGGGTHGKGGPVPNSDLAVFQNDKGGAGYRVKTCIEDTVVVVVMNSNRQLHGCIQSQDGARPSTPTWTNRIIPYIPQGVYQWKIRNPHGVPFMNIPSKQKQMC